MTIADIQNLIKNGESRTLELKKTTGELQDGMHSACAMLNSDGGYLIFGVTPSLKITGQQITDNTKQEIANALTGFEPAIDLVPEYVDVPGNEGHQLIVFRLAPWKWGEEPHLYHGCAYYKPESIKKIYASASLAIYDDRIEIINPGRLPVELTPETIFLPHSSYPHNPLIAQVLYLTTFLDKWGSGVGRIMELCKEANAPEPFYTVGTNEVILTFPRPQNIAKSVSDSVSQSVSSQQVCSKSAVSWQQVIETYSLDSALTWDKIEPFLQQVKSPRLLKEILNALGYNDPYYFKKTFINPLIQAGIISMTIPDKPTSSNQKYVLTDKGVKLLSEN